MKKINRLMVALLSICLYSATAVAQEADDSTGMPGDQFSLRGALELFRQSGSPEEFEKLLNTESNHVNNLDLDGDNDIDYIRVISKKEDNVHVFILQVAVSEKESQDIAVIELEKTGAENATIQIIGDEEIFGEALIVEPGEPEEASLGHFSSHLGTGPSIENDNYIPGVVVNVWFWPSVRFVYAPGYRPWISPWRWHYYPAWWRPWRPLGWRAWNPYRGYYHRNYIVVNTHRVTRAHRIYTPYRASSVTVRNRHAVARNNYTVTRTRTTVTGPRGNSAVRKTTTVSGRKGQVKKSRTTVRKRRG